MKTETSPVIWGIVVAGGSGRRFGAAKQHETLAGRPLWQWARDAVLEAGVDGVVVVGPVSGGVPGGDRRQDSVAAGLGEVPPEVDVVAVHDAARPLASAGLIRRLFQHLGDADGVIPGVGVADTVKRIDADGMVVETIDRSHLVAVQTPQVFRASSLRAAHAHSADDATDDAALIERWGGRVRVIEGEATNFKVTYPADLVIAERVVAERKEAP